jgi:hypothetical protein
MFNTCGSSSTWVRRRTRPNRVIRGSSTVVHAALGLVAGPLRPLRPHRPELEDREHPALLAHPRLPVEQRTAVAERVADRDEGDGEHER